MLEGGNMNQKTDQYPKETGGCLTTLCYMKRGGHTLMLYRNKKKDDVNAGKWIGVGGKLEPGEHPDEAVLREIEEETGYRARHCDFRGIILFCYNDNPPESMYLYTTEDFSGEMRECDEGTLRWIKDEDISSLNLWEGDRIFLELIGYHCEIEKGVFARDCAMESQQAECTLEKKDGAEYDLAFPEKCRIKNTDGRKTFHLTLRYHNDTLVGHELFYR